MPSAASETSPLLKASTPQVKPDPVATSRAAHDGQINYDSIEPSTANNDRKTGSPPRISTPNAPTNDVEQQNGVSEEQSTLHDGNPEVRKRLPIIFAAMCIGVLLAAADQTIIVSSSGRIGTDLDALSSTSWIATAYFLTQTSFQPLYGKLSDIFSRKSCLLFAYTVFGLGCVGCGLAPNIQTLIGARAFAGVGGGGMTTLISIILSDIIPLRERGTWQGYMNIIFSIGSSLGAPLGGLLSDSIGWRWAFLAQGPLCAVAFIVVALFLNLPTKEHSDWTKKLRRIDFVGALTLIVAVFSLLAAMDRGSNVAWKDKYTLAALGSSIPLFLLFVFNETRLANEPFAPGPIIFGTGPLPCYLCWFFSMCGYMSAMFYIPLYWQAVMDISAAQAGLQMIPQLIMATSGSLFSGFYMKRTGKYKTLTVLSFNGLFIGSVVVLLSASAIHPLSNPVSTAGMIIGMCITGFTAGIGTTTVLISLLANVDQADQAVAIACSYLFRSLGSAVGVALSATISNMVLRDSLQKELGSGKTAVEIATHVRQSLSYLRQLAPDVRAIAVDCYAHSIRLAFVLQMGILFLAAVSAWWVREKHLGK